MGILDFKATQHNKYLRASIISFFSELIGWIVFGTILLNMGIEKGVSPEAQINALIEIAVYCLGGAVGGFVTMKWFNGTVR